MQKSRFDLTVIGAIERKGNIVAKVVMDTTSSTIQPFVKSNICITESIKTDEYRSYRTLKKIGYSHDTVEHSVYLRLWRHKHLGRVIN